MINTKALTMSDRVAVMFEGRVAQEASPRDLYELPTSQKVASFIGEMTFIKGKIIGENKILKFSLKFLAK